MPTPEQLDKVFREWSINAEVAAKQATAVDRGLRGTGESAVVLTKVLKELTDGLRVLNRSVTSSGLGRQNLPPITLTPPPPVGLPGAQIQGRQRPLSASAITGAALNVGRASYQGMSGDPASVATGVGGALSGLVNDIRTNKKGFIEGFQSMGLPLKSAASATRLLAISSGTAGAALTGLAVATKAFHSIQKALMDSHKEIIPKLAASGDSISAYTMKSITVDRKRAAAMNVSEAEYMAVVGLATTKQEEYVSGLSNSKTVVSKVSDMWKTTGLSSANVLGQLEDNALRFGYGVYGSDRMFTRIKATADGTNVSLEGMRAMTQKTTLAFRPLIKSPEEVTKALMPFAKAIEEGKLGLETLTKMMYGSAESSDEQIMSVIGIVSSMPGVLAKADKGVQDFVSGLQQDLKIGNLAGITSKYQTATEDIRSGLLRAVIAGSKQFAPKGTTEEQLASPAYRARLALQVFGSQLDVSVAQLTEYIKVTDRGSKETLEHYKRRMSGEADLGEARRKRADARELEKGQTPFLTKLGAGLAAAKTQYYEDVGSLASAALGEKAPAGRGKRRSPRFAQTGGEESGGPTEAQFRPGAQVIANEIHGARMHDAEVMVGTLTKEIKRVLEAPANFEEMIRKIFRQEMKAAH